MTKPHYPYPGDVRALTQAQVGQLLAEIRRRAPPLVALAAWTQYEVAGRITEVLHLLPTDIGEGYVNVRRLKNSNASRVNVSAALLKALDGLRALEARAGMRSVYLFAAGARCGRIRGCRGRHLGADTVFRHVQAAGRAIGLDLGLCKTHVLRHSAITHAAELCADAPLNVTIRRLANFSGHKNLEHLLHYLSDPHAETEFLAARSAAFARITAPAPRPRKETPCP